MWGRTFETCYDLYGFYASGEQFDLYTCEDCGFILRKESR